MSRIYIKDLDRLNITNTVESCETFLEEFFLFIFSLSPKKIGFICLTVFITFHLRKKGGNAIGSIHIVVSELESGGV